MDLCHSALILESDQCSIFNSATALENETLQFLGNDHFSGQLLERFFPAPKEFDRKTSSRKR
jgi:hypothetical protein